MVSKFKKGDRVRINRESKYIPYGLTGTVLEDDDDIPWVEWDEKVIQGHNADGLGEDGYCRTQNEDYLELLEEEPKKKPKSMVHLALQVLELPNMTENLKQEASYILIKALQGENNE